MTSAASQGAVQQAVARAVLARAAPLPLPGQLMVPGGLWRSVVEQGFWVHEGA